MLIFYAVGLQIRLSHIQKEVTRVRKSTCYQTNGEKESSYVVHLNVDANSTDPVAAPHRAHSRVFIP